MLFNSCLTMTHSIIEMATNMKRIKLAIIYLIKVNIYDCYKFRTGEGTALSFRIFWNVFLDLNVLFKSSLTFSSLLSSSVDSSLWRSVDSTILVY